MGLSQPRMIQRVRRSGPHAVRPIDPQEAIELLTEGAALEGLHICGLDLSDKDFPHKITFRLCLLEDFVACRAIFDGGVVFERCLFEGTIIFGGKDDQGGMTCNGPFFISWCEFLDNAYFANSKFNGEVQFYKCLFHRQSGFRESHFAKISIFHKVTFTHKGSFREIQALSPFRFGRCTFNHEAYFAGAYFKGPLVFEEVRFNDLANFREVQFTHGVTFNACYSQTLYVEQDQVFGQLISEKNREYRQAAQEYHFLKENFARRGLYAEADACYCRFKQLRRRQAASEASWYRRMLLSLEWLFCDLGAAYGTSPLRVALLSLVIVVLFGISYYLWALCSAGAPIVFEGREIHSTPAVGLGDYLYFSLITFTTLGFSNAHPNIYSLIKYCVAGEALLGILLMTLFVGTLIRKIIR